MARIRTIKPEFWTDETVVELDFADRLLFIGLWNFADDQGYLPYRPKRIKMQVFPGDDYDVATGLRRLWESSLVSLYASPDGPLLHVRNWGRHQKISNPAREKYSPSDLHRSTSWEEFVQSPLETYPAEGKGKEGKGKEGKSESARASSDEQRADVIRLCDRLADRVTANGAKNVKISKRWHDAARLMLDSDGYTEQQVAWLIDKASDDEFWRSNILSMPKLRDKADQLRIKFGATSNVHHLRTDEQGRTLLPPLPPRSPWGHQ